MRLLTLKGYLKTEKKYLENSQEVAQYIASLA